MLVNDIRGGHNHCTQLREVDHTATLTGVRASIANVNPSHRASSVSCTCHRALQADSMHQRKGLGT